MNISNSDYEALQDFLATNHRELEAKTAEHEARTAAWPEHYSKEHAEDKLYFEFGLALHHTLKEAAEQYQQDLEAALRDEVSSDWLVRFNAYGDDSIMDSILLAEQEEALGLPHQLGNLHHFRCSHCNMQWHLTEEEFQEYQGGGRWTECPVCKAACIKTVAMHVFSA